MNSAYILLITLFAFILAYKFYAGFLSRLAGISNDKPTPAHKKYDGVDYVPAKHWMILFGHHFSSIAGAGPIVGPILVCIWWGWLPAVVWAVLGSIFIGGVHDFLSLSISVREGGVSVGKVAENLISKRAGYVFLVFVWLSLVLVVSVFALVCARTFLEKPEIVFPSLGIIPVALVIGFLIYRLNMNLGLATVIGLGCLALFIFLGRFFPLDLSKNTWITILFIYAFFASIIPVNLLLQPRDYLSSFLLWVGLIAMALGVFTSPKTIAYPAVKAFSSSSGGLLFPMMFITMACGAISGFHSLVSGGTTSKQLSKESDAKRIGYMGMLLEGVLAVLVVLCVLNGMQALGLSPKNVSSKEAIKLFSEGFGSLTFSFLKGWGSFLAIVILNSFILTTLDTATRITRYATQELFGIKSKVLSTFIVLAVAFILILSGSWTKLWQVFGASNQLLASLTLFVISLWLLSRKKKYLYAFIPGLIMLFVSLSALAVKLFGFWNKQNYFLFSLSVILCGLGMSMFIEVLQKRRQYVLEKKQTDCSEIRREFNLHG